MKKLKLFAAISLLCAAFLLGCSNPAGDDSSNKSGSNNNQQEDSSKTPVTPEKTDPEINIVENTFAGQVYYLDELDKLGNRSAERAAASAAEASKGIDTTRDRIVFAETGNGYTLFIGDKSYEGTYEVDLDNREISLTGKDSENTAVELSGTLSFSADAKSVEFEGVAKDESGTETKIEKKGQIKWDWSELGEWKQEAFDYKLSYSNLSVSFDEKGYVQLWRGEIDFTNAAYTRGIKIPATCFSNAKAGDYIAFLRPENGHYLSIKNDGPELKSRQWYTIIRNYNYDICYITQDLLDYINTNQGLNIYGNYAILEGIIIGSEGSVEVALKDFCSREYQGSAGWNRDWSVSFSYYVDSVHNNYTVEFNFKAKDKKDDLGLTYQSPDKDVYRHYLARGSISDLTGSVDVEESTFVLPDVELDKKFITYWSTRNDKSEEVELKEYAEAPVKMKFNIQKKDDEDKYTISFVEVSDAVKECLDAIEDDTLTLSCSPYYFYTHEDYDVAYDDLTKSGKWTSPEVEEDNILVWEGEVDYSTSKYEKGFYIPKEKFEGLSSGDSMYIIYPMKGEEIEISVDTRDREDKKNAISIVPGWGWSQSRDKELGACHFNFSDQGITFVKEKGLRIACDGNKVLKILIGKSESVDKYYSQISE